MGGRVQPPQPACRPALLLLRLAAAVPLLPSRLLHALRLLVHSTGGQGREPDPAEADGRRQEPTSLPEDEVARQRPRRPDADADGRIVSYTCTRPRTEN